MLIKYPKFRKLFSSLFEFNVVRLQTKTIFTSTSGYSLFQVFMNKGMKSQ